jgi:hypothetical protein
MHPVKITIEQNGHAETVLATRAIISTIETVDPKHVDIRLFYCNTTILANTSGKLDELLLEAIKPAT